MENTCAWYHSAEHPDAPCVFTKDQNSQNERDDYYSHYGGELHRNRLDQAGTAKPRSLLGSHGMGSK
jgi:hypothetical protein